jgi:hypothetical protein
VTERNYDIHHSAYQTTQFSKKKITAISDHQRKNGSRQIIKLFHLPKNAEEG